MRARTTERSASDLSGMVEEYNESYDNNGYPS